MKTLYTGGTFDIFHFGHVSFLKQCSMISDRVIVSLNTDEFIKEYKGRYPIMNYKERELSLRNCKYVADVVPNLSGRDSKPAILTIKPQIIAIGDDWAHKDYYKQMSFTREWLENNSIALVYVPYTNSISTSEIIKRVMERR